MAGELLDVSLTPAHLAQSTDRFGADSVFGFHQTHPLLQQLIRSHGLKFGQSLCAALRLLDWIRHFRQAGRGLPVGLNDLVVEDRGPRRKG